MFFWLYKVDLQQKLHLTDIRQMSGRSAPLGWRILHFEFGGMVNLSF
jgi:hypothetical protein